MFDPDLPGSEPEDPQNEEELVLRATAAEVQRADRDGQRTYGAAWSACVAAMRKDLGAPEPGERGVRSAAAATWTWTKRVITH